MRASTWHVLTGRSLTRTSQVSYFFSLFLFSVNFLVDKTILQFAINLFERNNGHFLLFFLLQRIIHTHQRRKSTSALGYFICMREKCVTLMRLINNQLRRNILSSTGCNKHGYIRFGCRRSQFEQMEARI